MGDTRIEIHGVALVERNVLTVDIHDETAVEHVDQLGAVMAADVVKMSEAETVNGKKVNIAVEGGTVMVNDAKVVATDVDASNGVIHVIDAVILPPEG